MTHAPLDDLDRTRFNWPEPMLIDLVSNTYGEAHALATRIGLAREHVRFLRELVEGDRRQAAFLRLELMANAAARGVTRSLIETADTVAEAELHRLVEARFRNSPRLLAEFDKRLKDGFARLPPPTASRPESTLVQRLARTAGFKAPRPARNAPPPRPLAQPA